MTVSSIARRIRKVCRSYGRDTRGNLTMMLGIAAIPIIAAAGMAVDYARISRVHDKMQLIADGATLAAAGAKNLSGDANQKSAARAAIATNYLTQGLATLTDASVIGTPTVTATTSSVKLNIKAEVKGSLINVLDAVDHGSVLGQGSGGNQAGMKSRKFDLEINSEATWNAGVNYVCMLALNESIANALEVKGTADIKSKNCSIWDNSGSNAGLYQNGAATITAKQINVVGNYVGSNFTPMPITNAMKFDDPLKDKFNTEFNANIGGATVRYNSNAQMSFSANTEQTIQPGIYSGGIKVGSNVIVHLSPGTYYITKGAFEIRSGGTVDILGGGAATIVMYGSDTKTNLIVQAGGNLTLKAPATAPFASLAIAHHPNSIPIAPHGDEVIGGGTIDITGILYHPKQLFTITGAGAGTVTNIATNSPYFAIVADKIHIDGNGQVNVSQASDFEASGLPALPAVGGGIAKVTLK